jgi:formylglycine-generating enzyme required for sulfatase activity
LAHAPRKPDIALWYRTAVNALPRVLQDAAQEAPLDERIAAAADLGVDDPRLGRFQLVPEGAFLQGSDPPEGAEAEQPARRMRTGAFEIGLVPVTVCEFARFVARGYGEKDLWSEEGWRWREENRVGGPRFWDEEEWRRYLGPNQPVVGVSWFEADAYARFSNARLPTESEWERAARGEDGRRYPWGDSWEARRAAHRGGPRHTLPVGCFPAGRSPHGLWDAAGNVWEWCADAYDPGAYRLAQPQAEAAPLRSARGGSWNALPAQLRCANRNAWPPQARYSNLGFRLARGPILVLR